MSPTEAQKYLKNPALLRSWIRERLVILAARDESVAIRAIELLLTMPGEEVSNPLADYSTADLLQLREDTYDWIASKLGDSTDRH